MKIVVVRHAEKSEAAPNPLTEAGWACALEAGAWLRTLGVRPVLVGYTERLRTRQTVEGILSAYGLDFAAVAQLPAGPMPVSIDGWANVVGRIGAELHRRGLDGDVILGVHHSTQDFIVRAFGARRPPKDARGATFLMEVDGAHTTVVAAWPGYLKRTKTLADWHT